MDNQNVVVVSLLVKSSDYEHARDAALVRLSKWFLEDLGRPEIPLGALLHYTIVENGNLSQIHTKNALYELTNVT
jgi:hypothetical protein